MGCAPGPRADPISAGSVANLQTSVASGRSHPGGCTDAWSGQPLGQPAPVWTRLHQDRAGRKGLEECLSRRARPLPPTAPPVGCLSSFDCPVRGEASPTHSETRELVVTHLGAWN